MFSCYKKEVQTLFTHPFQDNSFSITKKFLNPPLIVVAFPVCGLNKDIATKAYNKFRKHLNGLHAINHDSLHSGDTSRSVSHNAFGG